MHSSHDEMVNQLYLRLSWKLWHMIRNPKPHEALKFSNKICNIPIMLRFLELSDA